MAKKSGYRGTDTLDLNSQGSIPSGKIDRRARSQKAQKGALHADFSGVCWFRSPLATLSSERCIDGPIAVCSAKTVAFQNYRYIPLVEGQTSHRQFLGIQKHLASNVRGWMVAPTERRISMHTT
eukprot:10163-Amphidinium_carterae.1